jgi:hypothetical protein
MKYIVARKMSKPNNGIPPMTQQSSYPGSPQDAAIQSQNAKNVSQNNANQMSGGRYRRKTRGRRRKGGSSVRLDFLLSWDKDKS